MSNRVFGDAPTGIQLSQNDQALIVTFLCNNCESEISIRHPWAEIRAMLDGFDVPNVVPSDAGWIVQARCPMEDCNFVNSYEISQGELEREAKLQVARRRRMQRKSMPPQQAQGVPQGRVRRR